MKKIIVKALNRIEKEYNVTIILASESGSRAWGFPSSDSDYDVRFIYVNKKDWYLSMAKRSVEQLKGDGRVGLKTYMYAIRTTLCCQWIIEKMAQPPMHIDNLLAEVTDDLHFKDQVKQLIAQKKAHTEKYTVKRSEIIENYINKKIIELQDNIPDNPPKPGMEIFDDVLRSILEDSNNDEFVKSLKPDVNVIPAKAGIQ